MISRTRTYFCVVGKQITIQVLPLVKPTKQTVFKFGKHLKKWDDLVNNISAKYIVVVGSGIPCNCWVLHYKAKNIHPDDVLKSPPVPHERKVLYLA